VFIFFAYPKKTNQQRSGERKGSLSLAVSLLVRFAEFPAFMPPCGVLLAKSGRFGKSHFILLVHAKG